LGLVEFFVVNGEIVVACRHLDCCAASEVGLRASFIERNSSVPRPPVAQDHVIVGGACRRHLDPTTNHIHGWYHVTSLPSLKARVKVVLAMLSS
jgi:hypothetical protein